jgi:hypothetical protein
MLGPNSIEQIQRSIAKRRANVRQNVSCVGRFTRAGTQTVPAQTNMSELAGGCVGSPSFSKQAQTFLARLLYIQKLAVEK